ncbi:MAG: CoA-binding protein [Candidatus Omnitrophica bacterium]|nr:CoA-binding protein [Candidatus Omnitrophota bacterium]MDD5592274.1 CoA-binding protein [Candidatus Omnitrophota bacterium]
MENLIKDFLQQKRFAVIGSFRNKEKFAYRILANLIEKGYEVFPVNPRLKEIEGRTCYKTISDIPYSVDAANIVTPPLVTKNILKECLQKGIKKAWLQPGAESQDAIQFCHDNDIKVIHSMCIMLELLRK